MRTIPKGSTEIQPGLWASLEEYKFNGSPRKRYVLYSADGYCFWQVSQPECYVDGEVGGALLPVEERILSRYALLPRCITSIEQINADFVSVPIPEGHEII